MILWLRYSLILNFNLYQEIIIYDINPCVFEVHVIHLYQYKLYQISWKVVMKYFKLFAHVLSHLWGDGMVLYNFFFTIGYNIIGFTVCLMSGKTCGSSRQTCQHSDSTNTKEAISWWFWVYYSSRQGSNMVFNILVLTLSIRISQCLIFFTANLL